MHKRRRQLGEGPFHPPIPLSEDSLLHDVMTWNTDKTKAGGNTMEKCFYFCILFEEVGMRLVFT